MVYTYITEEVNRKKLHVALFFLSCTKEKTGESEGKCRKHFHLLLIAQLKNPMKKNLVNQTQFEAGVNIRASFLF